MTDHDTAPNPLEKPIVLLGAGGHAQVLHSVLRGQGREVAFVLDDDLALQGKPLGPAGLPINGPIDAIRDETTDAYTLVNAIGSAHRPTARQAVYERLSALGYRFAPVWHPSAIVAPEAHAQPTTQVMASAVLQPGAQVMDNALINTGAIIDHDSSVGEHTHVAPGAVVCGGVTIGAGCHIGAGATVVQGVTVGPGVVVGAGATVLKDVPQGQVVAGTPARRIDA